MNRAKDAIREIKGPFISVSSLQGLASSFVLYAQVLIKQTRNFQHNYTVKKSFSTHTNALAVKRRENNDFHKHMRPLHLKVTVQKISCAERETALHARRIRGQQRYLQPALCFGALGPRIPARPGQTQMSPRQRAAPLCSRLRSRPGSQLRLLQTSLSHGPLQTGKSTRGRRRGAPGLFFPEARRLGSEGGRPRRDVGTRQRDVGMRRVPTSLRVRQ